MTLYIGKVAELTGASRRAIRLYESQGLIPPPARHGNYRVYSDTEVQAIILIKRAQEAGFTLTELREFIHLKVRENRFPLELAGELIRQKRAAIAREFASLKAMQHRLDRLEIEIAQQHGKKNRLNRA